MVPAYDLYHVHRGMITIIPLCVRSRSMELTRYVCCKSIIAYFYLQHHHIITLAQQQSKLDASNLSITIFTWLRVFEIEPFLPTNMNHNKYMLEICPRGNNKCSYYYIFVFMINVYIHAITVLTRNINTCVICKLN